MEALVSLKAELLRKRQRHQEALAAGLPRHKLQLKVSLWAAQTQAPAQGESLGFPDTSSSSRHKLQLKVSVWAAQTQAPAQSESLGCPDTSSSLSISNSSMNFVVVLQGSVSSNKGVTERDSKDREAAKEEQKTAEKAKSALEKKAALYDKLQGGVAVLDDDSLNNSFLVNFQKKIVDSVLAEKKKRVEKSPSKTAQNESPDDWVEHVDAFGRSREVRRSELPSLLEQDRYLRDEEQTEKPGDLETEEGVSALQDEFEDAYRTQQRQRWEQQEQINAAKQNVHYQDVMFDEARTHGAGFLPLSGDADQRQQQQQLLRDLHAVSEAATRHHKREQRVKERGMAQRLAKIRQRKRLKRGLPDVGKSDEFKTPPESDEEDNDEGEASVPLARSDNVPAKRPDAPVREWDVGKQVIGTLVEPADRNLDTFSSKNPLGGSVEMTQELWVDRQRLLREAEFAPPSAYSSAGPSDKRKRNNSYETPCNRNTGIEEDSSLYQEEDRLQQKYNKNQSHQKDIINECTDGNPNIGKKYETSSVFDEVIVPSVRKPQRKGAEIAPPATFEYYAPNSKSRPPSSNVAQSLEDAISRGLKKIKEQA
ncbi:Protein of unknown function DUF4078 [Trinorchestia longiramus]|nr:Protein of unknown function DUF4078 [Trinorchestia longiramus]